ncbi:CTD phosphatase Fcp1 [Coemansia sp. RSA 988]|nr:CTD phosphatase Fcp1 [Coemansia sp. RSA 988]
MDSTQSLGIPRRHQPAKIVEFKVKPGEQVKKQAPLLTYEYREKINKDDPTFQEDSIIKALHKKVDADGTFGKREYLQSPFEGQVSKILCKLGDNVVHEQPLVEVIVPCTHGTVFNGLCALCGKDVSGVDTSGVPDTQANIEMFHDANGLMVSNDVAAEIDANTQNVLWRQRKLSLIIDLDQTIIHANATLNPEFESWLIDNYKGPEPPSNADLDNVVVEQAADRKLPSDIGSFYLSDSVYQYFIKLRPGLRQFLESISQLYEMHIYTMGSRPYADAVAGIIDPEGRYFNRRILSRDESGSTRKKNLRRLFPVDTSMVAILDDRADVWEWSPNLIKVHPYEFFRGVGDINAGNLPPTQPQKQEQSSEEQQPSGSDANVDSGALTVVPDDNTGNHPQPPEDIVQAETDSSNDVSNTTATTEQPRSFLTDRDHELYTLQDVLTKLHSNYYEELDLAQHPQPDLARILSSEKCRVLEGFTIVFTAAFPIGPNWPPAHRTELWWRARSFGAHCELEITDRTTHIIAGKPGTEKVHAARRARATTTSDGAQGACLPIVVKVGWLLDSIYQWESLDETKYLWYEEDKPLVARFHERNQRLTATKRKSDNGDSTQRNGKQQRNGSVLHASVRRVMGQGRRTPNEYESTNTTDIEDELERQEAGLDEHEAEVDSFVQNIDWDDLEREVMEDSEESDDSSADGSSRESSADHSKTNSRTASKANLRQTALRQAAKEQTLHSQQSESESSDVFESSSPGASDESGDESGQNTDENLQRHRMKRRRTSSEISKDKRLSKLAVDDGGLDIATNTEDSANDAHQNSDSDSPKPPNNARSRLAKKMGISLEPEPSILDSPPRGQRQKRHHKSRHEDDSEKSSGSSSGDSSGDDYYESDRNKVNEPLFTGIEDPQGGYLEDNEDDKSVQASSFRESASEIDDDGESSHQWGEDDEDDDGNFDDLINNLEKEISSS